MKLISLLFIITIVFFACKPADKPHATIVKQNILSPIKKYLRDEMNSKSHRYLYNDSFIIIDSLLISSLNSTLYQLHTNTLDDHEYCLIRDNATDLFYKILLSEWGFIGTRDLTSEDILYALNHDELEVINYDFMGLETFLNSCRALEDNMLNPKSLDSIISFC
ncbi:MAG: hypothetical protein H7259_05160, partial [Cytophagales bacterium]|nr:hypothetical protein [Cytophaga sp.]